MSSRRIRLLLWCGCLGAVILFAGDMLFYGAWGSARSLTLDYWFSRMANVALWRLHLGSITGPVGNGLCALGMLGLWFCCRRAAPRLAAVMLAFMYTRAIFGVLQHGIFGPWGFAIRYCGRNSDAVTQMGKLNGILGNLMIASFIIGSLIWIFLVLRKKAGVPRWTVLLWPFLTDWLDRVVVYVPAPIGYPLIGGWSNITMATWFAILALTYKDWGIEDQKIA